jgi:membrane protease YdiL (CAAX protease family)
VEPEKKEYPEPIEALVIILITFGFIFAVSLIITVMALFFQTESVLEGNASVLFIIGGLFFLAVPIVYAKMRRYDSKKIFRLNMPRSEILFLSFPIGLSLAVLTDELDRIIQIFIPPPEMFLQYLESLRAQTSTDWILLFLGVVIIAAVSEEILFRGFLQVSLEKKGDVTRAVILSSISWTIIHINPYWAVQIFITGIIIGFLAWRTNSVYPPMIVHATNNFLSLLVINMDLEDSMTWYLWGDHVSPLVLVISAGVLYYCIKTISHYYKYQESNP